MFKKIFYLQARIFHLFLFIILLSIAICGCGKKESVSHTEVVSKSEEILQKAPEKTESKEIVNSNNSIDLSKFDFQDMNLAVGCRYDLADLGITDGLICQSQNSNVACISDNDMILAQSEGKTNITVSNGTQNKQFQICVTNPQISVTEACKVVGNTIPLAVYGTTGEIEWQSDNDAIATVENGVVYAMPTGCGMSTNIHAFVDGKDLVCKINVEPIPQLDTTYKIYSEGHIRSATAGDYNCTLTAFSNANKIISFSEEQSAESTFYENAYGTVEEVLNLNKVDYSNGYTFPVYETYVNDHISRGSDDFTHIEVYLVGTSQDANIIAKSTKNYNIETSYQAENGYGVISVWVENISYTSNKNAGMIYIEVDGIEYCFNIQVRGWGLTNTDNLPKSDILEEYAENDVVEISYSGDYSELMQLSYTFIPNDIINGLGEKFIDALQDKAVSMCVDFLFSALFF